jgi:hypothetical protein
MERVRVEPQFAEMPRQIAAALFGDAPEPPEEPAHDFAIPEKFGYFAEPSPLATFETDESAEAAYRLPAFERKLLAPGVATAPAAFVLPEPPYVSPADFDPEEINANPIRRFFYDAAATIAGASPSTASHELSKRSTARAVFKKRRDESGILWNEAFNSDGELIGAMVVMDESEE